MPLRLPLLAIGAWALLSSPPMQGLPPAYRVWVLLTDDLLLTDAAILLALWAVLQVPAHLGLWPRRCWCASRRGWFWWVW